MPVLTLTKTSSARGRTASSSMRAWSALCTTVASRRCETSASSRSSKNPSINRMRRVYRCSRSVEAASSSTSARPSASSSAGRTRVRPCPYALALTTARIFAPGAAARARARFERSAARLICAKSGRDTVGTAGERRAAGPGKQPGGLRCRAASLGRHRNRGINAPVARPESKGIIPKPPPSAPAPDPGVRSCSRRSRAHVPSRSPLGELYRPAVVVVRPVAPVRRPRSAVPAR